MYNFMQSIGTTRVIAVLLLTPVLLIAFAFPSGKAQAQTLAEFQAQITQLLQIIAQLQVQLAELQEEGGIQPPPDGEEGGSGEEPTEGPHYGPGECLVITNSLYRGVSDRTTNGEVSKLQKFLTTTGDFTYPRITGNYGPTTEAAVKKWQARNGVVSSGNPRTTGYGVVGAQTRAALSAGCYYRPDITLTAPNGGEEWKTRQVNTITWTPYSYDPEVNPARDVTAYLEKKVGNRYVTVGKIMDNGKASIHTHMEIDRYGKYAESGEYYVRIVNTKTGKWDRSNRSFEVIHEDVEDDEAVVRVLSPNGGEEIDPNEPIKITWSNDGVTSVSVALYKNDKWLSWIETDYDADDGKQQIVWDPVEEVIEMAGTEEDLKIYITARRADGKGYVDDKSDRPFSFEGSTTGSQNKYLSVSASEDSVESGERVDYLIERTNRAARYVKFETLCDDNIVSINSKGGSECGEATIVKLSGDTYRRSETYDAFRNADIVFTATPLDRNQRTLPGPVPSVEVEVGARENKEVLMLETSGNDPDAATLLLDENSNVKHTVFAFELSAEESENGIWIDTIAIVVETSAASLDTLVDDFELQASGDVLSATYDVETYDGSDNDAIIVFDVDETILVNPGESVDFALVVEFETFDFAPGTSHTIAASVEAADISAEGEADDVTVTGAGSIEGATHTVLAKGVDVEFSGSDEEVVWRESNGSYGVFEIEFDVTAIGDDVFIPMTTYRGLSNAHGVSYGVTNGSSEVSSGSAGGEIVATADEEAGHFVVQEGETETFTLTVTYSPSVTDFYKVQLRAIAYNDSVGIPDSRQEVDTHEFETDNINLRSFTDDLNSGGGSGGGGGGWVLGASISNEEIMKQIQELLKILVQLQAQLAEMKAASVEVEDDEKGDEDKGEAVKDPYAEVELHTKGYTFDGSASEVGLKGYVDLNGFDHADVWFVWTDDYDLIKSDPDSQWRFNSSEQEKFYDSGYFEATATVKGGFVEGEKYYYRLYANAKGGRIMSDIESFVFEAEEEIEPAVIDSIEAKAAEEDMLYAGETAYVHGEGLKGELKFVLGIQEPRYVYTEGTSDSYAEFEVPDYDYDVSLSVRVINESGEESNFYNVDIIGE